MKEERYRPRVLDRQVEEYLSAFGAVCIEGPKWCGKTWTSSYHSQSAIYLGDPAGNFQNRQLAQLSPALVLEGEYPRLIDEWQEVPPLWDAVRYKVDLKALIALIIRGGWPGSLGLPPEQAALLPGAYLDAVIDDDVYRMDGVKRDTQKMRQLLRSLARNESTTATNKTLMRDIKAVDDEDIDGNTVAAYLDIFQRLFLTDNQPPFSTGIRSSVRVKQAEKRHFADPSLACALLKATPAGLLGDMETLGFLFEALCERDLRIYAQSFGGSLYHYQDYSGREIDAVIELSDGTWCAFEIKLGANQIDAAAENLLDIQRQFREDPKGKPPAVLCVLCGLANAAYRRPDGVFVVPLTALGC